MARLRRQGRAQGYRAGINPDRGPGGSSCWQRIARTVAVGNKPLCGNRTLTNDDRFQGRIRNARVLKG